MPDDTELEEIAANRAKAEELLTGPEESSEVSEENPDEPVKEEKEPEPEKESDADAKMAASFSALRKQKRHADQILQNAKEELRTAKAERAQFAQELELAQMLRDAPRNPNAFFEAARRAGVPAGEMADFLSNEKEPTTQISRELAEAKAELAQMKQYLTQQQQQQLERQQQLQQQEVQQAESQIGERFVGFLTDNLDEYPALATQSEEDIRASAIYWAREEYKATGNLPTAQRLATFLEHHALERVQTTPAARRAQVSQKPSQQARTARSSGVSLTNDDSSEAGISPDNEDSHEARRRRAIAVLSQNWHAPK